MAEAVFLFHDLVTQYHMGELHLGSGFGDCAMQQADMPTEI